MNRLSLSSAVLAISTVVLVSGCGAEGSAPDEAQPTSAREITVVDDRARSPSDRDGTCMPAQGDRPTDDYPARLTTLARTAGELLITNGVAAGDTTGDGTQLSIEQAFDRASAVPGDAPIVEGLWSARAVEDGLYDGLGSDLEEHARHIESFVMSDATLVALLGPNWRPIVQVIESFAAEGFAEYVRAVAQAPQMRVADALVRRLELQNLAASNGYAQQWDTAQSIATIYFQMCNYGIERTENGTLDGDELDASILGEVLVYDAVAAAFTGSDGSPMMVEPLTTGLAIVLDPEGSSIREDSLTKDFDPNEILSPEDVELMEAEEPSIEGP